MMSDHEDDMNEQIPPEPKVDLLEHYNDMRMRRLYHYVTYEVTEDNIIKERHCESGSPAHMTSQGDFEKFAASLPEADCRYVAYDYRYTSPEEATMDKLVFIIW